VTSELIKMSQSRLLLVGGLGLVGVAGIWLVKRLRREQYDDLDSAPLPMYYISQIAYHT
jgi:hypothetical protein